jgi:alkaline phosphatase
MQKLLFFVIFLSTAAFAQNTVYTTANAHSHNDYQQAEPFFAAYGLQYGSIEVDVILSDDELLVAHTTKDVSQKRTLEDLYLKPLSQNVKANNGYPYADQSRKLILMLDVKSDAVATINKFIDLLMKYPELTHGHNLTLLISGNKPDPSTYISYPSYLWFDGLLDTHYSKEALTHVAMLSGNFINYSGWKGNGNIPEKDKAALKKAIDKAHALKKEVRIWNAPDIIEGWELLTDLDVDFIDSDSIKALAQFLKQKQITKKS